ncbi:MAG: 50S ribosomal protein L31 [Patescibacteria group bacterium]|nr:50S ribosomal protein L31 [Patescibacteria group bacterium]
MKKDIHPNYIECEVQCVCGNKFTTKSILKNINVEVCGGCHPVFTGKQKVLDSTGRVERFQKMISSKKGKPEKRTKTEKRAEKSRKKIEATNSFENLVSSSDDKDKKTK